MSLGFSVCLFCDPDVYNAKKVCALCSDLKMIRISTRSAVSTIGCHIKSLEDELNAKQTKLDEIDAEITDKESKIAGGGLKKGEINFFTNKINTLKKLEFNFKSTDSTDTQEMKFYSYCRIQLNIKLSDLLIELNKFFDKKDPSLQTLNIWILNDSKKELMT